VEVDEQLIVADFHLPHLEPFVRVASFSSALITASSASK
jgi:hypothetical protein